ncbi:MAG: hypothetical protein JO239_13060, partial [Paraburkholderia sp.]|nr:hypothetical protein [Paraburkholderia sp.]
MRQDLPEAIAHDTHDAGDAHDAREQDPRATLDMLLAAQREAFLRDSFPSWEARARHLTALRDVLFSHRDALAEAMDADFGQRSKAEVGLAEFVVLKQEIDAAL